MIVELDKTFYTQLNRTIEDHGYIFGPSQIALILYGPIDKKRIRQGSLAMLKERENEIEAHYRNHVFKKLHQIVSPLSNNQANFPNDKKSLEEKMQVISFEDVRDEVKHFYREFKDLELDDVTKNNLFSTRKLKQNKYVEFGFDFKQGFLFAMRIKKTHNASNKFKIIYDGLNEKEKAQFGNFVLEGCKFSQDYWHKDCQEMMYLEFSKELNKLLINDYLGFKIVEFNENRASNNLERIARIGPSIEVKGFIGIPERFNDHRIRTQEDRPGGVHFTFVDSGHTNYPIEVQYLDSQSFIFDMFGPHCHDLYASRDKKRNPTYK